MLNTKNGKSKLVVVYRTPMIEDNYYDNLNIT